MTCRARLVFAALPLLAGVSALHAADLHVPADQPTIQQGIDAAHAGDRVLVAPGTYAEHVDFHGKNVQVIGTGGSAVTTIDGTHSGKVVTFRSGESRDAVLTGFSIVNGLAMADWYLDAMGGGVSIVGSSPTIADNDIHGNQGCAEGGGIGIVSGGDPLIHRNRIHDNEITCGPYSGTGAGLSMAIGARATISDNVIDHNGRLNGGGGMYLYGAGPVYLARNIVRGNVGTGLELGVVEARLFDNLIVRNQGFGVFVAGQHADDHVVLANNTIADNTGFADLQVQQTEPEGRVILLNNIVRTSAARESVYCSNLVESSARFVANLIHASNGAPIVGRCDFSAGGPITDSPRFAGGPGPHGYWLSADSPAIDAGDDGAVPRPRRDAAGGLRIVGGAVDLGAFEFAGGGVKSRR